MITIRSGMTLTRIILYSSPLLRSHIERTKCQNPRDVPSFQVGRDYNIRPMRFNRSETPERKRSCTIHIFLRQPHYLEGMGL
jgi:hypothetical protein